MQEVNDRHRTNSPSLFPKDDLLASRAIRVDTDSVDCLRLQLQYLMPRAK